MKKEMQKLLIRIGVDILGLAADVFVECVWKPFHLPHLLASFLGTAVCFLLLYDILRSFLKFLDMYIYDILRSFLKFLDMYING